MASQLTINSLPPEVLNEIFIKLDLESLGKARQVSKKWNAIILSNNRNFRLVCPISDRTLSTAINSNAELKYLNVCNLTGNRNFIVSATRGTGRIFSGADRIQFTGLHIDPTQSLRMMSYAFSTVKELIFTRCGHSIIQPLLQSRQTFHSLKQLTVECTIFAKGSEPLALGKISDYHSEMPVLQTVNLIMKGPLTGMLGLVALPLKDIFLNHLSIVKLVVKYKLTLKTLMIKRTDSFIDAYIHWIALNRRLGLNNIGRIPHQVFNNGELKDLMQNLEQLDSMTLDQVVVHSEKDNLPWSFEQQLLRGQMSLKVVDISNLHYPPHEANGEAEAGTFLTRLLPQNWSHLTSVKITLTLDPEFQPIDLAGFRDSYNLQILELIFFTPERVATRRLPMRFKNLDRLPIQITGLSFIPVNDAVNYPFHETALLTRNQLRWIVQNMRCLESFGAHLLTEELGEQIENADYPLDLQVNQSTNVNLATFRKLISMPKLRRLNTYLVQAVQVARVLRDEVPPTGHPDNCHHVYNAYIKMCAGTQNLHYNERNCSGVKPSFKYVILKIQK